ncbi:MAG: GntR family transcriptional regulator [Desulfatitalea sp.]|nr:GntR family transcriptional regulator [Desulfatitalea sp.]NNK01195.1 GntR family transcriptional regulator [Desulfatitalea sp.]
MALGQNIPLFFRVYHKLKQDIIRGEIPRGEKIGTIEELARQHGMSQTSVRKSLDLLEAEGLLTKKQGWGTTVPETLELHFFDLATLISSRKTFPEVKTANIEEFCREWTTPNPRLVGLMELSGDAVNQRLLRLYCRIVFTGQLRFKALMTFYFPEKWTKKMGFKDDDSAKQIIIGLTQWIESAPIKIKESLLPFLCTDDMAESLGLPDGTPVFFYTTFLRDLKKTYSVSWEMISTANIFLREMELNR